VRALKDLSRNSRSVFLVFIAIGGAALFSVKGFIGFADGQSMRKEQTASIETSRPLSASVVDQRVVDLSDKQAGSLKIGPVA
jgi:membrane fusion protein, heavy metal efflux system